MPFQKGQSGNPGGRPKETRGLRLALQKRYGADGKPLFDKLHKLTGSKNERVALSAIELILAYQYGKPVQAMEHSGANGTPLFSTPNNDYPAATID